MRLFLGSALVSCLVGFAPPTLAHPGHADRPDERAARSAPVPACPVALAEELEAHRVALDNAREQIDVLRHELAATRREQRRTVSLLNALGLSPADNAADVLTGLLDAAALPPGEGDAAPPSLRGLPLGDQVNCLALGNHLLRRELDRRDDALGEQSQELRRLRGRAAADGRRLEEARAELERLAREAEAARQARDDRPAPGPRPAPRRADTPAPRYEYTWQKQRIPTGETTTRTYRTTERGEVRTHVETSPAYDDGMIRLRGTFRNESRACYRYTFKVVALGRANCGRAVLGYEWVQTPPLGPGELYEWCVDVGVRDADAVRAADCVRVDSEYME